MSLPHITICDCVTERSGRLYGENFKARLRACVDHSINRISAALSAALSEKDRTND